MAYVQAMLQDTLSHQPEFLKQEKLLMPANEETPAPISLSASEQYAGMVKRTLRQG